ncbi:MAG TPA: biopolymer transporter ExbD [bacterium]|nr:biopolymer transporter ExbD [bacterium]
MLIERKKSRSVEMVFFPLVDIVLLLVIFFMLTSKFITQTAHNIDLPKSRTATVLEDKKITIYITKDHDMFLNDSPVTMDALPEELTGILGADPDKIVILKADSVTELGYTVGIVDIVRECGGKRLTITTEKQSYE